MECDSNIDADVEMERQMEQEQEEEEEEVAHETGKKRRVDEAVLPGVTKKAKLDASQPEHATHDWLAEEISAHHWRRPQPQINPATDSLIFLQIDTDYSLGPVVPGFSSVSSGPAPFVRLFGVTEQGNRRVEPIFSSLLSSIFSLDLLWSSLLITSVY